MRLNIKTFLPFLDWFENYRPDHLKRDVTGGLTVALVLIPQSMAYAQLAGLPPFYGLYAAFLPPIVAALFGSSRQLATGPVAVVSLMTAVALQPLATAGGQSYIAYAILLAFLVGIFQFTLGIFRLGLLVNFLSHPVVNGFTNAAAIIMMAVVGLINVRGFFHAWRAQWYDGLISVITFVCTLGFAPHLDRGIMVGVVLSVSVFLYKSMRPTVVDLSLGLDRVLHDSVAFGLRQCRYIDVVRFDGPLFFANASYLEDQIGKRRSTKRHLKHIIIVANGINDIDASGEEALSLIVDRVRSAGIGISLSGVNESVADVLKRTHLLAKIGEDNIYPNLNAAISAVHDSTHRGGEEKQCPLTTVVVSPERGIRGGE